MIEELVEQHHISALAITPLDCLLVETKINERSTNAEYRSLRLTPIRPTSVGCAMSGRKTFFRPYSGRADASGDAGERHGGYDQFVRMYHRRFPRTSEGL